MAKNLNLKPQCIITLQNREEKMNEKTIGVEGSEHVKEHEKMDETVFFIDMEKFETHLKEITVLALITEYAKEDPEKTTLVQKIGDEFKKFTNVNETIPLKDGMKFVIYHNGPTPVSMLYGPDRLITELRELGYSNIELVKGNEGSNYVVIRDFEIPLGKFAGSKIDLGIPAVADFPRTGLLTELCQTC